MRIWAGIGTRSPTIEQASFCRKIGKYLAQKGWVLSTGGAEGVDEEFTMGALLAGGRVLLSLPWTKFRRDWTERLCLEYGSQVKLAILQDEDEEAFMSVGSFHPAPDRLSQGARRLHARNWRIVFPRLKRVRAVEFIVALPKSAERLGGTGQGIRIGGDKNVPIIRLDQLSSRDAIQELKTRIK